MKVLSPREAAIFAALADAVAMPEPPRPPVGGTDAVEGRPSGSRIGGRPNVACWAASR